MLKGFFLLSVLFVFTSCATKVIPVNHIKTMKSSDGANLTMIGTLHTDLGDLTDEMKAAIDAADVVFVESSEENSKAMMQILVMDIFSDRKIVHHPGVALSKKANEKLDEVFKNPELQEIKNKFVKKGHRDLSIAALTLIIQIALEKDSSGEFLPMSTVKKLETFMRTHQRTILTIKEMMESHPESIDRRIEKYAKSKGKIVKSLDNPYDLVKLHKKLTVYGIKNSKTWMEFMFGNIEDQLQNEVRKFAGQYAKIKDYYLSKNRTAIAKLVDQLEKTSIGKEIFSKRNSSWTSEIDSYVSDNPNSKVVVAVGAGHLEGRLNLPFFLKDRNYTGPQVISLLE